MIQTYITKKVFNPKSTNHLKGNFKVMMAEDVQKEISKIIDAYEDEYINKNKVLNLIPEISKVYELLGHISADEGFIMIKRLLRMK